MGGNSPEKFKRAFVTIVSTFIVSTSLYNSKTYHGHDTSVERAADVIMCRLHTKGIAITIR